MWSEIHCSAQSEADSAYFTKIGAIHLFHFGSSTAILWRRWISDIPLGPPDQEVFRLATDEVRGVGAHLLGRRLYETMLYWETADQNGSLPYSTREFATIWRAIPKVVFSTTLSAVHGNARLASGNLAEEIEPLRAGPGESNIAIGGAALGAEAAALGLVDEYRARIHPVLVGGGTRFFPHRQRHVDLKLVESRTLKSRLLYLRYRVAR